jgi:hypothetical protein
MTIRGKAFIAGTYEHPRHEIPVEVTFHDTGRGNALPRFRPQRREDDDG